MPNFKEILSLEQTVCNSATCTNRKLALEQISRIAHDIDHAVKYQEVLSRLQQRERIGSTAIGHGVAIPHGRIPNLSRPICILISLKKAIEYDDKDKVAVDLIFGLLVPENATDEHLQILASLSNQLKLKEYREKLRAAETDEELYTAAISE